MSYVNGNDDRRAHTTPREKKTQARQIVDYARKLMLSDQPAGVEACNECLAQHLMLAMHELSDQIASGDLDYEKQGVAWRLQDFTDECEEMRDDLLAAAGPDTVRDRPTAGDFIRALLVA